MVGNGVQLSIPPKAMYYTSAEDGLEVDDNMVWKGDEGHIDGDVGENCQQ